MPSAFKDTSRGALAGHGLLPRELSEGIREGSWVKKCPVKFMPHLHTLSISKLPQRRPQRLIPDLLTQIAYANIIVKLPRKCLRVPTRNCKYQCFRFRWVNMSSPHKKVPSFQKKKNMAHLRIGGFRDTLQAILGNCWNALIQIHRLRG